MSEAYLTLEQAAKRAEVSKKTIKKAIELGELPRIQFSPRLVRIRVAALEEWMRLENRGSLAIRRRDQEIPSGGGVYFLLSPTFGLTKIGHAQNFRTRLSTIQSANPEDLELVGFAISPIPQSSELWFHEFFSSKRIRFEWFRVTESEIAASISQWKKSNGLT